MAIGDAQNDVEEFGADDSFGSGDGRDDRLELADVIDPEGGETHADLMSPKGEIGENAPSEANFNETMSIVQVQESIQVTADPGALSALDKGVAQPEEESTPEQGKAPGSASESGNPKQETLDSSDRPCRGSLPATVSKREQRRSRRENAEHGPDQLPRTEPNLELSLVRCPLSAVSQEAESAPELNSEHGADQLPRTEPNALPDGQPNNGQRTKDKGPRTNPELSE